MVTVQYIILMVLQKKYEAQWFRGELGDDIIVSFFDPNGKIAYIGNWLYGIKHGYYVEYDIDATAKYSGQYICGRKDGEGSYHVSGLTFKGYWEDDNFIHGKVYLEDGNILCVYDGDLCLVKSKTTYETNLTEISQLYPGVFPFFSLKQ